MMDAYFVFRRFLTATGAIVDPSLVSESSSAWSFFAGVGSCFTLRGLPRLLLMVWLSEHSSSSTPFLVVDARSLRDTYNQAQKYVPLNLL